MQVVSRRMGRHARLIVPGVALHVYQRGNNHQECFRDRNDRVVYRAIMRDLFTTRPCALHAYCLMTNHVHLLMTPQDMTACALLMRDLAGCYAAYFNRRHRRSGTLWEGRFGSCVVDSTLYVLGCYRYIELNPVRAGMTGTALDYEWSSARDNCGQAHSQLLAPHAEYAALGADDAVRQRAYRQLLDIGEDPLARKALREATGSGLPLLGQPLKAQLQATGARLERGKPGPRGAKLSK
jgi:putative transposase